MVARQPIPRPNRTLAVLPRPSAGQPAGTALADPTPDEFRRAIEGNQRLFLLRMARYSGGTIRRDGGVHWPEHGDAAGGEIHVPFPRFDPGQTARQLDSLLNQAAAQRPRSGIRLWSSDPARPAGLPRLLMARGFRPDFRPCWMRLDLWRLRDVRWGPSGLRLEASGDPAIWERFLHPDHGDGATGRAAIRAEAALARALPDQLAQVVAWLDGQPVGTATVHLTGGPLGIAAIYGVAVLPAYRNRGIGKAVTTAACRVAWARGQAVAGLNATPLGEPVYRKLGFEPAGGAQTWELPGEVLAAGQPASALVAFAEAIAGGDLTEMDRLDAQLPIESFDRPLACGLTPVQLAARFRQSGAAEWLRARGATVDLLSAWDLGWRKRAIRLLAERPELADGPRGEAGTAPLHDAVERGDVELASLLLAAGADPTVCDGTFDATPLDWARHFGRLDLIELLDAAGHAR